MLLLADAHIGSVSLTVTDPSRAALGRSLRRLATRVIVAMVGG